MPDIQARSNPARSHLRNLPTPETWYDREAQSIAKMILSKGYGASPVDLFIIPTEHKPLPPAFERAYGSRPHVNAFEGWIEPDADDNQQTYIIRHMQIIKQRGWKPHTI